MRLGFSVRVLGLGDLPAHDARRWPQAPHLSVSLLYLRDIVRYLAAQRIGLYRLHARLVPGLAEGDPAAERQLGECAAQLSDLRRQVREAGLRLTIHPYSDVILNTPDEERAARAARALCGYAALLDALGQGPEGIIVLHVGGVYDSPAASLGRFATRYRGLPEPVRRRVALENDDRRYSHADTYALHQACGVPLVYDHLHHLVLSGQPPEDEALARSLATWPIGMRPKVHYSTPRSEARALGAAERFKEPSWSEHSDYVNPFEFARFLRLAYALPDCDVMLEAKARDLALLRLRRDLARYASEVVASPRFEDGLAVDAAAAWGQNGAQAHEREEPT